MTGVGDMSTDRSFADEAFAATATAYANAGGDWGLAVQSAIERLFTFLADRPAETKACFVADRAGGTTEALARRDRTIDRFVELLRAGFAGGSPPPVVAEAIGGGIYELVRGHVVEQRLDRLPLAVPDATIVVLSPFIGADGARALAGRAASSQPS